MVLRLRAISSSAASKPELWFTKVVVVKDMVMKRFMWTFATSVLVVRLALSLSGLPSFSGEVGLLFGIESGDLMAETAFFRENHKLGVAFAAGIPLFQVARMQFHPLNALLQQEAAEITQSKDNQRRSQLLHCT
ncbi:hypothetical protein PC111_g17949, partial [Phytophthora cactorum]